MSLLNTVSFTPLKRLLPMYLFIIVVGTLMVTHIHNVYFRPDKQFFQTELRGTVQEIYSLAEGNRCRIGNKLYLIKGECIDYIDIGDSIATDMNSHYLKVFEKNTDNMKYYEEVEKIIFEQVGNEIAPKVFLWRQ